MFGKLIALFLVACYAAATGFLIGAAVVAGRRWWRERRQAARRRHEDQALTIVCARCDGSPWNECTCRGDCGRRLCAWATMIGNREFHRELYAMLEQEGGKQ